MAGVFYCEVEKSVLMLRRVLCDQSVNPIDTRGRVPLATASKQATARHETRNLSASSRNLFGCDLVGVIAHDGRFR